VVDAIQQPSWQKGVAERAEDDPAELRQRRWTGGAGGTAQERQADQCRRRSARELGGGDLTRTFTQGTRVRVRYARDGQERDAEIVLREMLAEPGGEGVDRRRIVAAASRNRG